MQYASNAPCPSYNAILWEWKIYPIIGEASREGCTCIARIQSVFSKGLVSYNTWLIGKVATYGGPLKAI